MLRMKLFWKYYSALFIAITLNSAIKVLDKDSVMGVYYNTTIIFSNWFIIPYFLNILNVLISCLIGAYLFGYAFDRPGLSRAPVWLFYVRLLSDFTGHTYELKVIQSSFSQDKLWGLIGIASLVLPILPSYLAQWRMSFKQK